MLKYIFFILILVTSIKTAAQSKQPWLFFKPDTTVVVSIFPSIGWDSRVSNIDGKWTDIKGLRAGIRFGKKRHRLTLGYRWFSLEENIELIDYKTIINPRYLTQLEAYYYNLTYQHIFIDKYRYAVGTTFDVGLGATYDEEKSYLENANIFKKTNRFIPIQVGVYGEWKATRFVGLIGNLGYRWAKNYTETPAIDNAYFDFGARIYLGSIIRYVNQFKQESASVITTNNI